MLTRFIYLDPVILTEQQLLDIHNAAFSLLKEGKTVMSWEGEGTSATKAFVASPLDIIAEARYALKVKNPIKYGYIATRSRAIFA